MSAPVTITRPAPLCYHAGEVNRCPQCNGRAWNVGRFSAECAACHHPLPLAHEVRS